MLKKFTKFLAEANSVGARFEQKTADAVQRWIAKNGLVKRFKASRYQTVDESDGGRDEDYSDVVVEDLKIGSKFFIECKEIDRSNVINVQYDITENGELLPVKGKAREQLSENETGRIQPLTKALSGCDGFSKFKEFLLTGNDWLRGKKPAEYYFGKAEDVDDVLPGLITAYNKSVRSGEVEADCKPFDRKNLRDSTKNMLAVALAWRLDDPNRTWDICKVQDAPFFGKMMKRRYSSDKAIPARYIQFGDKLFRLDPDNDPLGIGEVPVFPSDLRGDYALKFTPRFGTGSVYVTPRSEITSEFDSDYSFIDREKWPSRAGNKIDESVEWFSPKGNFLKSGSKFDCRFPPLDAKTAKKITGLDLVEFYGDDNKVKSCVGCNGGGRAYVVVEKNGIYIPFYVSSGDGGKDLVPTGHWYPFFGKGPDGWLNKGSQRDILNYYGSRQLKLIAQTLDNCLDMNTLVKFDSARGPHLRGFPYCMASSANLKDVYNRDVRPVRLGDAGYRKNIDDFLMAIGDFPIYGNGK